MTSSTLSAEFTLPEETHIHLAIYNLKGELVRTLLDGSSDAGYHSTVWNGRTETGDIATSGVYLYKLTTEGWCQTRKLLLIK